MSALEFMLRKRHTSSVVPEHELTFSFEHDAENILFYILAYRSRKDL